MNENVRRLLRLWAAWQGFGWSNIIIDPRIIDSYNKRYVDILREIDKIRTVITEEEYDEAVRRFSQGEQG